MIPVTFRPIDTWPGGHTQSRRHSPFRAAYADTLDLLDRELHHLAAKQVVIQLALRESDIRLDGLPRAGARVPDHPGVILAFDSTYGPLKYATDVFHTWQGNLRAITLGLEALRKVDRYGITKRGEQYTGWKALPAGIAMGPGMTRDEAREILGLHPDLVDNQDEVAAAVRKLVKLHHPDNGGDREQFQRVLAARDLLARR